MFNVGSQGPNPCAIAADTGFILSYYISGSMMTSVKVQPVAIALQLKLFLAKALFIGP